MERFKEKYRIASNRCKYWDYSSPGYYFITICTNNRECFLGEICQNKMHLTEFGKIVENEISKIPGYHKLAKLDEWVIMPNHIHLLIELTGEISDNNGGNVSNHNNGVDGNYGDNGDNVEKIHEFSLTTPPPLTTPPQKPPKPISPTQNQKNQPWWHNPKYTPTNDEIKQYRKQRRTMIIPKILGKLQMQTSKNINIKRNTPGIKNWQPNYHDHIVRNEQSYQKIKKYIMNNPKNWNNDKFCNN